jgi:hemin uptake protein HemP
MMNSSNSQEERDKPASSTPATTRAERKIAIVGDRIDSRDLFVGAREIIIGHGSDFYRLRLTAQNKLILTK